MSGMRLLRRLRFNLQTLMLVVSVIAVGMGWLARNLERANAQRRAVAKLKALQGVCLYDYNYVHNDTSGIRASNPHPPALEWLHRTIGVDFFHSVVSVDLIGSNYDDADLVVLKDLPRLKQFTLFAPARLLHGGLDHLRGCRELRSLSVYSFGDLGIRNSDLALIRDHTDLEKLTISAPQVTDAGINRLVGLKRLVRLDVDYTAVTVVGIAKLKALPRLREVGLPDSRVNRDGIDELRGALPLVKIDLEGPSWPHQSPWEKRRFQPQ